MAVSTVALTQNIHARRFVKFCIVGASSTLVQMVTLRIVTWLLQSNSDAAVQAGNAFGVALAILNGFYWNRRWTFRQAHTPGAGRQFRRFIAVNLVGFTLNAILFRFLYVQLRLFHDLSHVGDKELQANACQLVAIAVVVLWNFTANSLWTFNTD